MAGILTSGVWKDNYLADTEFHCHVTNKRRGVVVSTGLNPCTSLYSSLGRLRVCTAVVYAKYNSRRGFIVSNNCKKIGKIVDRGVLCWSVFFGSCSLLKDGFRFGKTVRPNGDN